MYTIGEGLLHNKISLLFFILISLLTIGTVEFLHSRDLIPNVSAVEATENIGVYWDENCGKRADSINWGVLSPNETEEVVVYVRNEGNESFLLVLSSLNWNPENAPQYLYFSWSCADNMTEAGEVAKVTQRLKVSSYVSGISTFSFDIIFDGRAYFLGDVNGNGKVDLDDVLAVAIACGSIRGTGGQYWHQNPCQCCPHNPNLDIDGNGKIELTDYLATAVNFGKTGP